jgi:hypothetical protein
MDSVFNKGKKKKGSPLEFGEKRGKQEGVEKN